MILDRTLRMEVVLGGAITTNQLDVIVDWQDTTDSGDVTPAATTRTATNSGTDVTILDAPVANPKREPLYISIYNKDTVNAIVTIKTDDGTTERIIIKHTLTTTQGLYWARNTGWYVL